MRAAQIPKETVKWMETQQLARIQVRLRKALDDSPAIYRDLKPDGEDALALFLAKVVQSIVKEEMASRDRLIARARAGQSIKIVPIVASSP